MSTEHTNGKGIHLTDEQIKGLLIMLMQHDEKLARHWALIEELMLKGIDAGWPISDATKWRAAAVQRQQTDSLLRTQRQRFFEGLGLKLD